MTKDDDLNTKLQRSVDRVGQFVKPKIGTGQETKNKELSRLAQVGQFQLGPNVIEPHLKQQLSMYDSIPNFFMNEFSPQSSYTRAIGIELLQILIQMGLDLNC